MKKIIKSLIILAIAGTVLISAFFIFLHEYRKEKLGIYIENHDSQQFVLNVFVSEGKRNQEAKYVIPIGGSPGKLSCEKTIIVPLERDEFNLNESDLVVRLELLSYPEGKVIYRRICLRYDEIQGNNGDPPLILEVVIKRQNGRVIVLHHGLI
jgi:hypothetical protein